MPGRPATLGACAAITSLLVGLLVYLIDRQGDAYFLPVGVAFATAQPPLFGSVGAYLPSFLHVYAFILLTVICLPPRRALVLVACGAWFAVECFFEAGQHPALQALFTGFVPAWFDAAPLLEASAGYFLLGHFDPLDILAAGLGATAAWLTIHVQRTSDHENA